MWPKETCLPYSGRIGNEQVNRSELTDTLFPPLEHSFPPIPVHRLGCAFPYSLVGHLRQKTRMQEKATALDLGEGEDLQPSFQVITALQVDYSTHD